MTEHFTTFNDLLKRFSIIINTFTTTSATGVALGLGARLPVQNTSCHSTRKYAEMAAPGFLWPYPHTRGGTPRTSLPTRVACSIRSRRRPLP